MASVPVGTTKSWLNKSWNHKFALNLEKSRVDNGSTVSTDLLIFYPLPSNSHRQGYYIGSREPLTSFVIVTGCGSRLVD